MVKLLDALNKEIELNDIVFYWKREYGDIVMKKGRVTKFHVKTISVHNSEGYIPSDKVIRVASRNVIYRDRQIGDTIACKKGAYLCSGRITKEEYGEYLLTDIRRICDNKIITSMFGVRYDNCIKIKDGKKSIIRHLKGIENV